MADAVENADANGEQTELGLLGDSRGGRQRG